MSTLAFAGWGLLGSLLYGWNWQAVQSGQWTEWMIGGQLRWLPWAGYAVLIVRCCQRLQNKRVSLNTQGFVHLALALGVILSHAAFLRLIRPIPPMLLHGRNYADVFARFKFVDYLSYQSVFMDAAVYLAIAIPASLILFYQHRSAVGIERQHSSEVTPESKAIDRLAIRVADKLVVVPVVEIEWLEAADYYVQVHCRGERFLHRQSIQSLEQVLPSSQFVRVHRRALVNCKMIVELVATAEFKWAVRMKSGALVEVSRRRRQQVERMLKLAD